MDEHQKGMLHDRMCGVSLTRDQMCAFLPFSLYKAASIFANDIADGYNVESNRQMLEFILDAYLSNAYFSIH